MSLLIALLRRLLRLVPPALSSTPHIIGLIALGCWLIVLPLIGIAHPSAYQQLIGGNYANMSSALGACIAAGTTLHIAHRQDHHTWTLEDLRDSLMHLHQKHNRLVQLAQQLGAAAAAAAVAGEQPAPPAGPAQPPAGASQ